MDWCRLSSGYYRDPALVRAGEAAEVLFLRMIAYCAENETRGRIPKAALPMLTPTRTKARLVALLREGPVIDDGPDVLLRSWERIQESHDTEAERRRKDRERKAAERAADRLSKSTSVCVSTDSPRTPPRTVQAKSARKEVEVEKPSASVARKRATPPPDVFPITEQMAAWGRTNCPLVTDPHAETRQFLDHARANGKTFVDWIAAWRTWMANAQKYTGQRGAPLRGLPSKVMPPGTSPHRAHLYEQA